MTEKVDDAFMRNFELGAPKTIEQRKEIRQLCETAAQKIYKRSFRDVVQDSQTAINLAKLVVHS